MRYSYSVKMYIYIHFRNASDRVIESVGARETISTDFSTDTRTKKPPAISFRYVYMMWNAVKVLFLLIDVIVNEYVYEYDFH